MLNLIQQLLSEEESMSEFLPQQPNSFLLSLMTLSAYMISADGIVMESELDFTSVFLARTFGEDEQNAYMPLLHDLLRVFRNETPATLDQKIMRVCERLNDMMSPQERYLLMTYLMEISRADNFQSGEEVAALAKIGNWLNLNTVTA